MAISEIHLNRLPCSAQFHIYIEAAAASSSSCSSNFTHSDGETMGTRQVYEEKLKRGNLHHDPTIKPGLGSARCPRCLSLLDSTSKSGEWGITPVLHDFTAVAGSGIGGLLSTIYGFNTGIPFVQRHVKGPKWLPFVVGLPPFVMFSAASAVFGGYALPRFTQLTVTSYYAASSASHYGISLLTRHIEEAHTSGAQRERLS